MMINGSKDKILVRDDGISVEKKLDILLVEINSLKHDVYQLQVALKFSNCFDDRGMYS